MNDIHPHWHSTGDEAAIQIPQRHAALMSSVPEGKPTVSRRPAAITGIFLVLGTGFLVVQGISSLRGQLSVQEELSIHITAEGFEPNEVTAQPGQTITFINDHDIPHILQSDDLRSDTEEPMYTLPIEPEDTFAFTVSGTQENGSYSFISITASEFIGTVIIEGDASDSHAAAGGEESSAPLGSTDGIIIPEEEIPRHTQRGAGTAENENAMEPSSSAANNTNLTLPSSEENGAGTGDGNSQESLIPQNPYSVESGRTHSFEDTDHTSAYDEDFVSAPRPMQQPATGAPLWIVSFLSLVGTALVSHRYLKRV